MDFIFPYQQPVLQISGNQLDVPQFNSDTPYPELVSDSTGLRAQPHKTILATYASHKC